MNKETLDNLVTKLLLALSPCMNMTGLYDSKTYSLIQRKMYRALLLEVHKLNSAWLLLRSIIRNTRQQYQEPPFVLNRPAHNSQNNFALKLADFHTLSVLLFYHKTFITTLY